MVPEALLPAPYDFGADVDTQVALFSASGQGTLEGDPSCALSWTASASTLELTVTQVPNASTCISLGDVHSITPLFFDETSETLLYVRSSIGSETHTRLMLDRRDVLGPNLDASAIASLLTSEQVLVSGEQLVDPTDYIGDGLDGFILDIGDIDAVVLKNDGTISADNLPVDGTARYISSVTPGAVQSEDWQWILTTQGIEFDDPATSATSTIDPVSGQLTTIPDVHWRILELDEDNRLWVIETEIIPSTPYTESRLNFYTVLNQDQDGDLEADLDEVIANTDPFTFNDADGDGLSDFDETNNIGTNPAIADSDGDGVTDGIDADPLESSVSGADTDLDGIDDAWAATYYTGALNPDEDLDGDSLTVRDEYVSGTLDTFFNERQIITAPEPRLRLNRASRIPLQYSVSDNNQFLPGLGLRIHFHGSAFSLFKLEALTPT